MVVGRFGSGRLGVILCPAKLRMDGLVAGHIKRFFFLSVFLCVCLSFFSSFLFSARG